MGREAYFHATRLVGYFKQNGELIVRARRKD